MGKVLLFGVVLALLYLAASGRLDAFIHALATGHADTIKHSTKGIGAQLKSKIAGG